jgi:hypothetical protein
VSDSLPLQAWREALIREYAEAMKEALNMVTTGTASPHHAVNALVRAGIHGVGTLRHYSLEINGARLSSVGYVDLGGMARGTRVMRTDSTATVQTEKRMYLISSHLPLDSPLTMADTRVVSPLVTGCALAVHTSGTRYLVTQEGTFTCGHGEREEERVIMREGSIMHLKPTQHCHNRCIVIGTKRGGLTVKQVDEQPAIHPHQIQVLQPAHVGKPKHREDDMHKLNIIMHEGLKKNMRESEDMIKDMREELDGDARTVHP